MPAPSETFIHVQWPEWTDPPSITYYEFFGKWHVHIGSRFGHPKLLDAFGRPIQRCIGYADEERFEDALSLAIERLSKAVFNRRAEQNSATPRAIPSPSLSTHRAEVQDLLSQLGL